ncbi:PREDICTED: probable receptor-like protein kinase At1g67000 [Populus euphratica]|uniref:Probable receptor-like protein kinase At1g67000 n=2 Tax=Populus euphratica TaxID=75702 RepID=A0AAJ6T3D8_POPEU|nr:PREDICTED: probable receptor-like protein kinase At1g67000 [Populus euphratica]
MSATKILLASHTGTALVLFLIICIQVQTCRSQTNHVCAPSSCGRLHNISLPFRLKGDPPNCGFSFYELSCENNQTVLYMYSGRYLVQSINYNNSTIRVVDSNVNKGNCSSLPQHSLTGSNFSYRDPFDWRTSFWSPSNESQKIMMFMKCANPVKSPLYMDTAPCINVTNSYVLIEANLSYVENLCKVELIAMSSLLIKDYRNISYMDIHNRLVYGFELWWKEVFCGICKGKEKCYLPSDGFPCPTESIFEQIINQIRSLWWFILMMIAGLIIVRTVLCSPFVFAFLIYKWLRRHLSMYDIIEEFLQSQNNFAPIRYSYSDIKKITNGFKERLGQGGYGSVYKGKLRSGHLAAVKMLDKSSANGQDFINEVATIGRIHHVNVVRLIGFCAEGSKRALVYDFMPNGSLDKYVLSRQGNTTLSWQKMYEISLGVARGIEYLHRGCDMQILHFDIKPHNVLLDENFAPKVSDFGLAKLYPTNNNTVMLTAARGTIGYIAPELFYKNIGSVSYKADVYSFGMLLMEMVGKRQNTNPVTESNSENYFPDWVYNQVVDGRVEIGDATKDENKLAKKMIIVALWCIQMKPINRPPMNKVVEMLEGDVESLEFPPKPVLFPDETPPNYTYSTDETCSSSMVFDSNETISLLVNSG